MGGDTSASVGGGLEVLLPLPAWQLGSAGELKQSLGERGGLGAFVFVPSGFQQLLSILGSGSGAAVGARRPRPPRASTKNLVARWAPLALALLPQRSACCC